MDLLRTFALPLIALTQNKGFLRVALEPEKLKLNAFNTTAPGRSMMGTICNRRRSGRTRFWNCQLVLLVLSPLFVPECSATHFRFGHFNWEPTGNPGEVQFHLVNAFRRSGYAGSATDGFPRTGDIITEAVGATSFMFGDGQSTATLQYRVIAFSQPENWIVGEALQPGTTSPGLRHTYAAAVAYNNVGINTCCRLTSLNNRSDGTYILSTRVTPRDGNRSPVSSLVPIVVVQQSSTATFSVPAADPDGDRLRWRLSTAAEAGGGPHPPNLAIDPDTGIATWNNVALDTTNPWTTQIIIEDLDSSGDVKSRTPVDFFLRITTVTPPTCTVNPPGPFDVAVNTPISFIITGSHPDPGAAVTLNSGGLPAGAVTVPSLPATGPSGVQARFNWTPTQVGTHQIVFSATGNDGGQALCPVTITVRDDADLSLTKIATPEPVKVTSNLTYSISVTNNGPAQASDVLLTDTLPPGVTFLSASSSQGSCMETSGVVTCMLGALNSGASASVTLVVVPNAAGSITNHARVTSSSSDPNLADNETTVVSTVEPANDPPVADGSASDLLVISGNNVDALVRLDASLSSDPNGDPLTYNWFEGAFPLASGVTAEVRLDIGIHTIDLVVSDGLASDSDLIEAVVISASDAINLLVTKIEETDLGNKNKRPLLSTLRAAVMACNEGRFTAGLNQLEAFQNKIRTQIAPGDPVAAACFNDLAQQIIDAVNGN
jgi:uncharacterized repeat protein (TIGR01451 family)